MSHTLRDIIFGAVVAQIISAVCLAVYADHRGFNSWAVFLASLFMPWPPVLLLIALAPAPTRPTPKPPRFVTHPPASITHPPTTEAYEERRAGF